MGASNFIPTVFRWWTNPTQSEEKKPKKVKIVGYYVFTGLLLSPFIPLIQ